MYLRLISKHRRFSLLLACTALLISCDRLLTPGFETEISELRGGAYVLDKDHAALLFKVNHLGFSTFIGRFTEFDAVLDFDPENIQNSSLEVIVNTASLNVNLPVFEEELRGNNWFNVEQFPQALYRTTSFLGSDQNTFVFAGDLTFLGVTAPVNLNVTFHGGGRNFLTRSYTLGFSAESVFKRSDFGMSRFTSFGVGDEVELEIHVEFKESD
jgi:polyisoprenoid-binding protein YceI